jgi:predicted nucleotidyltransferase
VDLLLHPADDLGRDRPDRRRRLSTVGHGRAFRAFARAARRAGVRFMVIGGTFRDVAVRAASTRDIDIVLIDRKEIDPAVMRAAGFTPVPRSPHAWRYAVRGRAVDLEIAAVASSDTPRGPFSVAFQHAEKTTIEGLKVTVPRLEDYVILKLIAAGADRRRRARDLADVQHALEAYPERARDSLAVAAVRARLRDLYDFKGQPLKELVGLFREVPRPPTR